MAFVNKKKQNPDRSSLSFPQLKTRSVFTACDRSARPTETRDAPACELRRLLTCRPTPGSSSAASPFATTNSRELRRRFHSVRAPPAASRHSLGRVLLPSGSSLCLCALFAFWCGVWADRVFGGRRISSIFDGFRSVFVVAVV